jgi:hypothetical protein
MAKYYPRSQTFVTFVISGLFVAATAIAVYGFPQTKNQVSYKNKAVEPIVNVKTDQNFKEEEWQKSFFDQSDNKIDTKKANELASKNKKDPLTPTELLSRNFFTKFAELKQAGLANDANAIQSVTNQLVTESLNSVPDTKIYTLKDITSLPNSSDINSSKKYAEGLISILSAWLPETNEVEIAKSALESEDFSQLKKLDPIIANYKKVLNRLKALPVPERYAVKHLDLVNGLSSQVYNASVIRNVDKDALTALTGIGNELGTLKKLSNTIDDLQRSFSDEGIVFVVKNK